tara:strand:- start:3495 stop:4745 length:1251 start_codon:yes stop_codon:yes gene_type:complete
MKTVKKRNPDPRRGLPEGAWFYEPLPGFPSDPGSQFRFWKEAKNEDEAVREAKAMVRALGPEVVVERPTTPGGPFRLHHGEPSGSRGLFDMERSWFPQVSNLNPSPNPHTDEHTSMGRRWFVRRNRTYRLEKKRGSIYDDDGDNEYWLMPRDSTSRRPTKKLYGSYQEIFDTLYKAGYREWGRVSHRTLEKPSRYVTDNPGYHRRRNPDDLKPLSGSSPKQVKYGEDMRRQILPRIDEAVEQAPELSQQAKLMRAMPTARFWIDLSQRGADVMHSLLNTDLGEQSIVMRYYAKPAEISTRRGMTKVGGTRPYLRKYYFTGRAENLGVDKEGVAAKKQRQEEWAKESARSSPAARRAQKRQEEKEEQEAEDEYERQYRESGQLDRDIDEWKIGRYDPGSPYYEEDRASGAGYPMGKP